MKEYLPIRRQGDGGWVGSRDTTITTPDGDQVDLCNGELHVVLNFAASDGWEPKMVVDRNSYGEATSMLLVREDPDNTETPDDFTEEPDLNTEHIGPGKGF